MAWPRASISWRDSSKTRASSRPLSGSRCVAWRQWWRWNRRPSPTRKRVPEGDTVWRAARTLQRAIGGRVVTRFETVLVKLARVNDDTPVAGRVVEGVESAGKWLVMRFSGDLILLTHMLMSGSWHIYRPGERWKRSRYDMRIVIETAAVKLMKANITERSGDPIVTYFGMRRTTGRSDPTDNLWVYHRTGKPCRKCGTAVVGRKHWIDARSSFWCPACQRM